MKTPWLLIFPLSAFFAVTPACSSSVEIVGTGGGASSSSSTGGDSCQGDEPTCVYGCGSDASAQPNCVDGTWICPPDTVNMNTCPPGTCIGPPLACEVCDNGWKCAPTEACVGSCSSFVCATCNGTADFPVPVGACMCSCKNGTEYGCELIPGCCNTDQDCGDESFVPCVEHVCKQPVQGQCWSDAECGVGMKCVGASVCPCNYDCEVADSPGMCVPG